MAFKRPEIDNFSKNLNEITPSQIENLSPSLKKNQITNTIKNVKSDICNKIDGALNLVIGISSGSIYASLLTGLAKDAISSFFDGPLNDLTGKLKDVINSFEGVKDQFDLQNQILDLELEDELKKVEEENIKRFESAKINKDSFDSPIGGIQNLSTKALRDINTNPFQKASVSSLFCKEAEDNLIDKAVSQKSIKSISIDQEKNISKINESFDKIKDKGLELIDSEERKMINFSARSDPSRRN